MSSKRNNRLTATSILGGAVPCVRKSATGAYHEFAAPFPQLRTF